MSGFKTKKINTESFGSCLKRLRRRKKISLEQAEQETTVRAKYLRAFEEENFADLPANAYAIGYLEKYCDFLEAKTGEVVKQFKVAREFYKGSSEDLILPKKINEARLIFTPRLFMITAITVVILVFFGYIWYQFKTFTSSPPLKILTPNEQAVVTTDTINIEGLTDEGAKLSINSEPIKIDENGKFETQIKLQNGVNTIEVVSENKVRKQSKKTITVLAKLR